MPEKEAMTNEEMVLMVRSGKEITENMKQLYLQNKGMIVKLAFRIAESFTDSKPAREALQEELEQEAYFGLNEAVSHWKQAEGASFLTYAVFWIKQAMFRYASNNTSSVRLPEQKQQQIRDYRKAAHLIRERTGRRPTDSEITAVMNISVDILEEIQLAAGSRNSKSLDQNIEGDEERTVADTIADSRDCFLPVIERINQQQLQAVLWAIVEELPTEQADVIKEIYLQDKTMRQISREKNVPLHIVRKRSEDAYRTMRREKYRKKLEPFAIEWIHTTGMQGIGVGPFMRTGSSATERTALKLIEPGYFRHV